MLFDDGSVRGWGNNDRGQLVDGAKPIPTNPPNTKKPRSYDVGWATTNPCDSSFSTRRIGSLALMTLVEEVTFHKLDRRLADYLQRSLPMNPSNWSR